MPRLGRLNLEPHVKSDAIQAIRDEKALGLWQSFKLYRKAVFWSLTLSTCIVMEGFDLIILTSLYVLPAFQRQFGTPDANGEYVITAKWQMILLNLNLIGQILGLLLSGYFVEKIGYKYTLIGGLVFLGGSITAPFCAESMSTLAIGQILCGIPWGIFQTTTTTYASEVTPLKLRPLMTTYVNFCWCLGQLISSLVLKRAASIQGPLSYKIPFGSQWIWILPVIIAIFFAPESPWWLIRQGRTEDARRALKRLTSRHYADHTNTKAAVNMMFYTNELEKSESGGIHYLDCFTGTDLRRTEISCNVWAIQIVSGGSLMQFAAYFYKQAGMSTQDSFSFQSAQFALGMVGTMLSWYLMRYFGRRTLYLAGQAAGLLILLGMGIAAIFLRGPSASWTAGSLLLAFTFFYDATVGPVCFSIVAEISSTRLRNKTIVLARVWYNVLGVAAGSLTPQMLSPGAWGWGGKTAFFYAATSLIMLIWTYFRLPETKERSFAEMDLLFGEGVRARDFSNASVHLNSSSDHATSRGDISLRTRNTSLIRSVKGHSTKQEDGKVHVERAITVISERGSEGRSTEDLVIK